MARFGKGASPRDRERLRKMRATYPFRLVIDKAKAPRPESLSVTDYGHFGSFPMTDGVEFMFHTRSAREKFIAAYGGTILGE